MQPTPTKSRKRSIPERLSPKVIAALPEAEMRQYYHRRAPVDDLAFILALEPRIQATTAAEAAVQFRQLRNDYLGRIIDEEAFWRYWALRYRRERGEAFRRARTSFLADLRANRYTPAYYALHAVVLAAQARQLCPWLRAPRPLQEAG